MIIEIALGIVLALVILALWPWIVGAGLILIAMAVVALIIAAVIFNLPKAIGFLALTIILFVSVAVPFLIFKRLMRLPRVAAAVDGTAPYNSWRRLPMRIAVTGTMAVVLVVIGISIASAGGAAFDYYERTIIPKMSSPS